ncbi:MAG: hypothetical protein ACAI18_12420, partial [Gemmatimonadales bacterium]
MLKALGEGPREPPDAAAEVKGDVPTERAEDFLGRGDEAVHHIDTRGEELLPRCRVQRTGAELVVRQHPVVGIVLSVVVPDAHPEDPQRNRIVILVAGQRQPLSCCMGLWDSNPRVDVEGAERPSTDRSWRRSAGWVG